jgi:multidrug resistance efflux pump
MEVSMKRRRLIPVILILVLLALAAIWYVWGRGTGNAAGPLAASGTVEAVEVIVAPEISGRATKVLAAKGETVAAGQLLLQLDDTLLQAQRKQAEAARDTAAAGVETARATVDTARLQYQQVLEAARLAESPARSAGWNQSQPWEFDQPAWYFDKSERIAGMQLEVVAAAHELNDTTNRLKSLLDNPEYAGVQNAEQQLAQARAAFLVAQDVLDRAENALSNEDFLAAAQDQWDMAKHKLEDAQTAYDDLLDAGLPVDMLTLRADIRAAEERYYTALDRLYRLHTGENALTVQIADSGVRQAEMVASQAEKTLAQARTQLNLIDAQIAKLTVYAPADGVVLERNIEPGEMALAGSSALVIGKLDHLTITVYIPEDRYGEIRLGQIVRITVDSFPDKTFSGSVARIAQRAEFTPRNVQTEEGRRTTVFAVEIAIDSPGGDLKPGMPADVTFEK